MVILGIDPGLDGAIAAFDFELGLLLDVRDMPSTPKPKRELVARELYEIIQEFMMCWEVSAAFIERVHSMPGQGVASTFKFGFVTGIVHGILAAADIRTIQINPTVWKPQMGLTRDKSAAITRAKKLFPNFEKQFSASKDGRAEAALIAYFGSKLKLI